MIIDIERILLEIDGITPLLEKLKSNRVDSDDPAAKNSYYEDAFCLQSIEGCDDPFHASGSMKWYPYKERSFSHCIFPQLKYTNKIIKDLNLYRTRILNLKSKTCLNYHCDNSPRIHIPLITNEDCFFILEDQIMRFPADGNYYYVDTRKKHTAVNASNEDRIHMVGCVRE